MNTDEIKKLIRTNSNDLMRHEERVNKLRSRVNFCIECKFEEEVRIAQVRLEAMELVVYDYRQFIKGLQKLLEID